MVSRVTMNREGSWKKGCEEYLTKGRSEVFE